MKKLIFPNAFNKNQDHKTSAYIQYSKYNCYLCIFFKLFIYKQLNCKFMNKVCGLDVHKDSVFACILDDKGEKILEERFGTLTPDLDKLRDTLVAHGVGRVAMESTSIYPELE